MLVVLGMWCAGIFDSSLRCAAFGMTEGGSAWDDKREALGMAVLEALDSCFRRNDGGGARRVVRQAHHERIVV